MIVDVREARTLVSRYVCSDCWGELAEFYDHRDPAHSDVRCGTEGCACKGFVTRSYTERRLAEQRGEAAEAGYSLRTAIAEISQAPQKTQAELLKDIGF